VVWSNLVLSITDRPVQATSSAGEALDPGTRNRRPAVTVLLSLSAFFPRSQRQPGHCVPPVLAAFWCKVVLAVDQDTAGTRFLTVWDVPVFNGVGAAYTLYSHGEGDYGAAKLLVSRFESLGKSKITELSVGVQLCLRS
jgi:hypothetical protein